MKVVSGGKGSSQVDPDLVASLFPSVPDFIQHRMTRVAAEAHEMYLPAVEVGGVRPAKAHRDPAAADVVPTEVFARMDRIVTSDFKTLKEGVDYDKIHGTGYKDGKGSFRTVSFMLPEPIQVGNHTIYAVRLKGVAFDPSNLDREFDLLRMQAEVMGWKVPSRAVRMDWYIDEAGKVVQTPHVNEPLGGGFLSETLGEARAHRRCLNGGEDVDYPLNWYEYDPSIVPPNGLRLGAMAVGLTSPSRLYTGAVIGNLSEEYDPVVSKGDMSVIDEWREKTHAVFLAYVRRLARWHRRDDAAGKEGFYHESPHPGQFYFAHDNWERIASAPAGERMIAADLLNVEPLTEMPYAQKIGCIALDLKSMLAYAGRYDSYPLFNQRGFDFMSVAMQYFDGVDDRFLLDQLASFSKIGQSGRPAIENLFQLSAERKRPIIEFGDNPLVKALKMQYPE
ncbi:Uncharacterised protein [uncultured archaeon]|nr:Uncharacterised protein [uncultured archaeon]